MMRKQARLKGEEFYMSLRDQIQAFIIYVITLSYQRGSPESEKEGERWKYSSYFPTATLLRRLFVRK